MINEGQSQRKIAEDSVLAEGVEEQYYFRNISFTFSQTPSGSKVTKTHKPKRRSSDTIIISNGKIDWDKEPIVSCIYS